MRWFMLIMFAAGTLFGASDVSTNLTVGTLRNAVAGCGTGCVCEVTMPVWGGHAPALVLDGSDETWFWSSRPPQSGDCFTVRFSEPREIGKVTIVTGKPGGKDKLRHGVLEVSRDGVGFTNISTVVRGRAAGVCDYRILAVRLRCTGSQNEWLAIRQIKIESKADIRNPVKVKVEVLSDDLQEWKGIIACLVTDYYNPLACLLLGGEFKAPESVTVTIRDSEGVAATIGNHITVNADWIRKHPDDYGMIIHELSHVIQGYPKYDPVWLIESLADYCRFEKFEGEDLRLRIDPQRTKTRDSYQKGAAFLTWLADQYGDKIITEISISLRRGTYSDELFKKITGASLEELHRRYTQGR